MSVPFYYHSDFSGYDFGANHPFRGERFAAFMQALESRFPEAYGMLEIRTPSTSNEQTLELAHSHTYVQRVKALEKRRGFLSLDTQLLPGSVDAARLIVGASVAAAHAALENNLAIGFGGLHHAGPDYGEGFCIFNDVAIAASVMLGQGLERIMILDTDAHQGNGTMDIFYSDPRVLFISLHQDPRTLYPGRGFVGEIGNGAGAGYTVNIPMPPLSVGTLYDEAMREIVVPLIDEFNPDFIIRNGGSEPGPRPRQPLGIEPLRRGTGPKQKRSVAGPLSQRLRPIRHGGMACDSEGHPQRRHAARNTGEYDIHKRGETGTHDS